MTAVQNTTATGESRLRGRRELARVLTTIRERPEAAARCRRGLGKVPMNVPEMWEYCVPVVLTVPSGGG
jgi:hypothetical protein